MSACTDCRDTGYTSGRVPCTCDARPFEPGPSSPPTPVVVELRVMTPAQHRAHVVDDAIASVDALAAIDELLAHAYRALSGTIGLGELTLYLQRAPMWRVAPRITSNVQVFVDGLEGLLGAALRLDEIAKHSLRVDAG